MQARLGRFSRGQTQAGPARFDTPSSHVLLGLLFSYLALVLVAL